MVLIYIIQHVFSTMLLDRKLRNIGSIFILILFLCIQLVKRDSYDLISYTQGVEYSFVYEPLFQILINLLKKLTNNPRDVVGLVQILLAANIIYLTRFFKNRLVSLSLILLSVFFYLSVNNALRQGFASLFLLLSIIQLLEQKTLKSMLFGLIASFFHFSSPFFILGIFYVFMLDKKILRHKAFNFKVLFLLLSTIISILILKQLILLTPYAHYLDQDLSSNLARTPLALKLIPISVITLISEYFMSKYKGTDKINMIRLQRYLFLGLAVSASIVGGLDELGSRIIFFVYAIELLLVLHLSNFKKLRPVVFIMLSYSFAFNVWNIISA